MKVNAIMSTELVTVTSGTSLDEARSLMDKHVIRHLPVVDRDELVGILSDRDVLEANGWLPARMHACGGPAHSDGLPQRVEEISRKHVVTAAPEDEVLHSALTMLTHRIGCLPVLKDGQLVGIITEMDLLGVMESIRRKHPDGAGDEPKVASHMTTGPITINWYTSFDVAVEICRSNRIRHLPVLENGRLVGIVSDRDLRRAKGKGRPDQIPVNELMSKKTVSLPPEATLWKAAALMHESRFSALPVVSNGEFVGILTLIDLIEQYLEEE